MAAFDSKIQHYTQLLFSVFRTIAIYQKFNNKRILV